MYKPVPKTVDFPALELQTLRFWEEIRAFDKLVAKNRGNRRFSFIDGPITANNPMGVHHAWGRTYKDLFQRYKAMQGFDQRFQNGFDCQGLWVEVEVERELGLNSKREIERYGLAEFAERCKERVYRYADMITRQSIRLGMWMDWENSYYTLSDDNIQHIWTFLKQCHENGWLYQGHRASPWCVRCGTALAQHELVGTDAYREIVHTSVYVKLPIQERPGERFLVWTTTPWTLTANTALAVHPDLEYARVRQGDEVLYLSPRTLSALNGPYEVLGTVRGSELVGLHYTGPFDDLPAQAGVEHRVVPWDEVSDEEGTGIVHIAPGCGAEDFELSKVHGLAVLVPINEVGDYVEGYGDLTGQNVRRVNEPVFESLRSKGLFYKTEAYTHRYPVCWRCGEELVFRLSSEWFIRADEIRPRMIRAAREVQWVPASAGKRMEDWLNNMGDWNISRRRYWGLPLPFYPCTQCGHLTVVGSMQELKELAVSGLDQLRELHRPWIDAVRVRCRGCGAEVSRVPEVGDAWLDAGIVPFSTLHYLHDRSYWETWFPADFITEMREQIRLWFYSMLFMSVTLKDTAPYRAVLAYEKLLDEVGRPMHRSLGNAIWFDEAAERMGADVMRWMYASQPVAANLLFGYGPAEEVKRKLLTLWNTYNFYVTYANAERFNPLEHQVPLAERGILDRWILSRLHRLIDQVRSSLDEWNPAPATDAVERFVDDLSTWYLRRSRRRFGRGAEERDQAAAFLTLYECLVTLSRLLAPFLPFLSEELYQNLVRSVDAGAPESVHLTSYPEADPRLVDDGVEVLVAEARTVVSLGRAARTQAGLRVRQPLARLRVATTEKKPALPEELVREIAEELNVKAVDLGLPVESVAQRVVKPRPQLLGPRLGKAFPAVQEALRQGRYTLQADGSVEVAGQRLAPEEVEVALVAPQGYTVVEGEGYVVALDTRVSPELLAEGRARELVHRIQTMRREAGLTIEDRVIVRYEASEAIEAVLRAFADYIRAETLSVSLTPG
ncbi:MAG TPA: isoleucine--tRNA ligase, partial [Chloroflexota bacterium]